MIREIKRMMTMKLKMIIVETNTITVTAMRKTTIMVVVLVVVIDAVHVVQEVVDHEMENHRNKINNQR
jgi:hypothetical protein